MRSTQKRGKASSSEESKEADCVSAPLAAASGNATMSGSTAGLAPLAGLAGIGLVVIGTAMMVLDSAFLHFSLVFMAIVGLVAGVVVMRRIQYLSPTEQLLVKKLTEKIIINGPAIVFPSYIDVLSFKKRKATSLSALEYVQVRNTTTGSLRVVRGPTSLLLGATDVITTQGPVKGTVLTATQGLLIRDAQDGTRRLVKGPTVFVPEPFDTIEGQRNAICLQADQYCRIEDINTGSVSIERGENVLFLEPHLKLLNPGVKTAFSLKSHQYVRLRDTTAGAVRVLRGERLVFPEAHEEAMDGGVQDAIHLRTYEYCMIQDRSSGVIRCERGDMLLWLGPNDRVVGPGKQQAAVVDTQHAVLVRNKETGVQALFEEPQLFIPKADEEVVEVRDLIRLAEHEAVVLKDAEGNYDIRFGDPKKGTERAFFLPPDTELVTLKWSRGRRREHRDLMITVFDTRPQYMSFEFNCRTSDNVEMILEGTFFWEVEDIASMLHFTGDASGDVCAHARSCFIQLISKVTLKEFMDSFNEIAKQAHSADDEFYKARGIKIHSLEVTRYACADRSTAGILEQIIAETTNRMNRLSVQESENEVELARVHGAVELENAKSEVLQIQQLHAFESARAEGLAEAERCVAFLHQVQKSSSLEDAASSDDGSPVVVGGAGAGDKHGFSLKLAEELWHALRKSENMSAVANGSAHVYFTTEGANLTLENRAD